MPLPSNYISTAERETSSEIKSNYWSPSDIQKNETDELILCGVPDDHMIAGWQFWSEDGPNITRTEPTQEEWIKLAKPGYGVKETKEQILDIINNATNRKEEWAGLKLLDRRTYFLAFAAYHCERGEFICAKISQSTILKPLEGYLRMEEDYMPMSEGGVYNFRLGITKVVGEENRLSYQVTVRPHRAAEKKEIAGVQTAWEEAKAGMWLPRYFMAKGENNVFDGKPADPVMPAGLPVMTRDDYGADQELKGF